MSELKDKYYNFIRDNITAFMDKSYMVSRAYIKELEAENKEMLDCLIENLKITIEICYDKNTFKEDIKFFLNVWNYTVDQKRMIQADLNTVMLIEKQTGKKIEEILK